METHLIYNLIILRSGGGSLTKNLSRLEARSFAAIRMKSCHAGLKKMFQEYKGQVAAIIMEQQILMMVVANIQKNSMNVMERVLKLDVQVNVMGHI